MKVPIFLFLALFISTIGFCQSQKKDIVKIIDDLPQRWDNVADGLETYGGFKKFCRTRDFRVNTIDLLNQIHHYDTILYQTVSEKYKSDNDPEAKATLDDIDVVEVDYSTASFLDFLHAECGDINDINRNFSREEGEEFEIEKERIENELEKYVESITQRIDNIDEHIHHLKKLYE